MTTQGNGAVVEVRGAWQGEVGDPGRTFVGTVAASNLPDLNVGQPVTVAYGVDATRVPGAGEHGTYTLADEHGGHWPLMGFTCSDTGTPGRQGNDDTAEALWRAVPLPL